MGGHRTVTASDGYEFKITNAVTGRVWHSEQYTLHDHDCGFTGRETGCHAFWDAPIIEFVKIEKPKPAVQFFEFGWPVEGKKGDLIHIDRNGHWELRRSHPQVLESPTYTTVASGGSFIWSGV